MTSTRLNFVLPITATGPMRACAQDIYENKIPEVSKRRKCCLAAMEALAWFAFIFGRLPYAPMGPQLASKTIHENNANRQVYGYWLAIGIWGGFGCLVYIALKSMSQGLFHPLTKNEQKTLKTGLSAQKTCFILSLSWIMALITVVPFAWIAAKYNRNTIPQLDPDKVQLLAALLIVICDSPVFAYSTYQLLKKFDLLLLRSKTGKNLRTVRNVILNRLQKSEHNFIWEIPRKPLSISFNSRKEPLEQNLLERTVVNLSSGAEISENKHSPTPICNNQQMQRMLINFLNNPKQQPPSVFSFCQKIIGVVAKLYGLICGFANAAFLTYTSFDAANKIGRYEFNMPRRDAEILAISFAILYIITSTYNNFQIIPEGAKNLACTTFAVFTGNYPFDTAPERVLPLTSLIVKFFALALFVIPSYGAGQRFAADMGPWKSVALPTLTAAPIFLVFDAVMQTMKIVLQKLVARNADGIKPLQELDKRQRLKRAIQLCSDPCLEEFLLFLPQDLRNNIKKEAGIIEGDGQNIVNA